MNIRRTRGFVVGVVLAFTAFAPGAHAEDDADARRVDWDVYQRDVRTIDRAIDRLAAEARSRGTRNVLIALDQITFRPPPGHNEYTEAHDYAGDVDAWLESIGAWAKRGAVSIHVVGTLGPAPLRVGPPGWRDSLAKALAYPWYEDPAFSGFEPALKWIRRWAPAEDGMLVLIASELAPERWADQGRLGIVFATESWRRHLCEPGDYWDEEAIGKMLERIGTPLVVVAPEVCFGDELPLPALPAMPWASRPRRPLIYRLDRPDAAEPATPDKPPAPKEPQGPESRNDELRRALDTLLRPHFPDPVQRKRIIDRILAEVPPPERPRDEPAPPRPTPPTSGGRPAPTPATKDIIISGRRFRSDTALWFPHYGGTVILNDHTPAAFGYWPYARAAARSGGRYLDYPFPPAEWLDACPRDDHQLKRLAPELQARSRIAKACLNDPALHALSRAEALVVRKTPWMDGWGQTRARGWDAFATVRPLEYTRGFRLRRKPYDPALVGTARDFRRQGERLAKLVLEYDAAMKILDRALRRIRDGKDSKSRARSVADLRLGRFWFAMSAFHLDALGIYMREIERFAPSDYDLKHERLTVTYLPTIRLSDCLDAYDGRTLSVEDEARYVRVVHRAFHPYAARVWKDGQVVPGQQGHLLTIPEVDPNYRAKRSLSSVLRHLDRRLMPRALDMIEAAREVMRHHGKTPWGWTTYYSEAYTFVFHPVDPAVWGSRRTGGEEDDEPGPVTPSERGGGRSTPGGPTTGR